MSSRPKKISFRKTTNRNRINNINQDLKTLDKIVFIDVQPHLDKNGQSAESGKKYEQRFFRLVSKVLKFNNIFGRISNTGAKIKSQKESFNSAMKYLILFAQILGIFPIFNFKENHIPNNRYKWSLFSWRYIYCAYVNIIVLVTSVICFHSLISSATVTKFSYFAFYFITLVSSLSFMRLSRKWHYVIEQLETANLNEYVDPFIEYKCNFVVFFLTFLASVEHVMAIAVKLRAIEQCMPNHTNVFQNFIKINFFWLFNLKASYSTVFGVFLCIQNYLFAMIWNYLHVFVICISLFLSSILAQINKVILSQEGQYLPPSYWRKLREDYNRATRLVRCFDDVINTTTLISFAGNLFTVCAQLYYLLSVRFRVLLCLNLVTDYNLDPTKQFRSYLFLIFALYALSYMLLRSLAVALTAAKVHSASLLPAPALYSVPSPTFCTEVQRFIEQIHGSTVGLTGLNFFYITKELILSVVGTIVTYELVLLQFIQSDRIF